MGFMDGEHPKPEQYLPTANNEARKVILDSSRAWRKSDRPLRGWIKATVVWGFSLDYKLPPRNFSHESQERVMQRLQLLKKDETTAADCTKDFKSVCDEFAEVGKSVCSNQRFLVP